MTMETTEKGFRVVESRGEPWPGKLVPLKHLELIKDLQAARVLQAELLHAGGGRQFLVVDAAWMPVLDEMGRPIAF